MKFTLAAFKMSSTPMRMPTALRRVTTVTIPSAKRAAPTIRKWGRPIEVIPGPALSFQHRVGVFLDLLAGDDHCPDQRSQQHHRGHLEGEEEVGEEGGAQRRADRLVGA